MRGVERARRDPRGARPPGARRRLQAVRGRAPHARRDALPLRQVHVRARPRADEARARARSSSAAASRCRCCVSRRARGNPVPGQDALPARCASRRAAETPRPVRDHVRGPRLDQGGDGRLREHLPRARHGDARVRRSGPGRGRVRHSDPRRLRGGGEGGRGLRRDAQRRRRRRASACGASRSAATTRRARRRSRSASRRASRSPGPYSWVETFDGRNELSREAFRVRSHSKTMEEAREVAKTLTLEGVAKNITCPIYVVGGELDNLTPPHNAQRIAAEVSGPVRAPDRERRQPRRQQPPLHVPDPDRGLDGTAAWACPSAEEERTCINI